MSTNELSSAIQEASNALGRAAETKAADALQDLELELRHLTRHFQQYSARHSDKLVLITIRALEDAQAVVRDAWVRTDAANAGRRDSHRRNLAALPIEQVRNTLNLVNFAIEYLDMQA